MGPGGRGIPYKSDRGAHRILLEKPLKGTNILFCGRGPKLILPLRGIKIKHNSLGLFYWILFSFQIFLKPCHKFLPEIYPSKVLRKFTRERFETQHPKLRGTKTALSGPKKYDKHPVTLRISGCEDKQKFSKCRGYRDFTVCSSLDILSTVVN